MKKVGWTPKAQPLEKTTAQEMILYVEDEDANWEVAKLVLSRSYTLVRASTDVQACEIVRTQGELLSTILMDIQLCGSVLDGVQLTKLLRGSLDTKLLPSYARNVPVVRTPILFVTAYGSNYRESELLAAGADRLIAKPVDFAALNLALASFYVERAAKSSRPR